MAEEKVKKAGVIAVVFSLLCPVVGFILYFIYKDEVKNANLYMYAALIGLIINLSF